MSKDKRNLKSLSTPVLFLAFNRPEKTERVFNSIRAVRPQKLYVAVDGPRAGREDDLINSDLVKAIVKNVDWPCEVHYLFHEKNLGCSLSGYTAWKWIMESEDRMIFVEDDGLGSSDAFYFIEEMLERYKDNPRVVYVGAVNYGPKYGEASYFYSRIPSATYFMGTWKRVIEDYEYLMESFKDTRNSNSFKSSFVNWQERKVYMQLFDSYVRSTQKGPKQNTYDIQMSYLSFKNKAFCIYPNVNLAANIGLDGGANNSCPTDSEFYKEYGNRQVGNLGQIVFNDNISYDPDFEISFFKKRVLYLKPWYRAVLKSYLYQHFGNIYNKWLKKYRRR